MATSYNKYITLPNGKAYHISIEMCTTGGGSKWILEASVRIKKDGTEFYEDVIDPLMYWRKWEPKDREMNTLRVYKLHGIHEHIEQAKLELWEQLKPADIDWSKIKPYKSK